MIFYYTVFMALNILKTYFVLHIVKCYLKFNFKYLKIKIHKKYIFPQQVKYLDNFTQIL